MQLVGAVEQRDREEPHPRGGHQYHGGIATTGPLGVPLRRERHRRERGPADRHDPGVPGQRHGEAGEQESHHEVRRRSADPADRQICHGQGSGHDFEMVVEQRNVDHPGKQNEDDRVHDEQQALDRGVAQLFVASRLSAERIVLQVVPPDQPRDRDRRAQCEPPSRRRRVHAAERPAQHPPGQEHDPEPCLGPDAVAGHVQRQHRARREQPASQRCRERRRGPGGRKQQIPEQCEVERRAPVHGIRRDPRAKPNDLQIAKKTERVGLGR